MKRMAEAKQKYDQIPIPKELSERVMMEIKRADDRMNKKAAKAGRQLFVRRSAAAAAAVAVVFTFAVNANEAFAREIRDLPVVGPIARVLSFRFYETETDDIKLSVDIPSVEMISEELGGLEASVNEEIHEFCRQYADEAVLRAEEYRQAFLETGGSEEEWADHDIEIKVWYEVKALTDEYVSIAVMGDDGWNNAGYEAVYYSFDKKAARWVTLKDLLDDAQLQPAEESVRSQIEQREAESGMEFWGEDWQGIDEYTKFYINSTGNPVIVFEPYEIAPGAAGRQEYEITV